MSELQKPELSGEPIVDALVNAQAYYTTELAQAKATYAGNVRLSKVTELEQRLSEVDAALVSARLFLGDSRPSIELSDNSESLNEGFLTGWRSINRRSAYYDFFNDFIGNNYTESDCSPP